MNAKFPSSLVRHGLRPYLQSAATCGRRRVEADRNVRRRIRLVTSAATVCRCVLGGVMLALAIHAALAAPTRLQTIQLHSGWNAVYLEVQPADSNPATVFAGTPVDIAAAYYAPSSSAQFMTDPGANLFRQAGWGVWYAADRPDAFLKTLYGVFGQQAYLLHATGEYTWQVTGSVEPPAIRWQANAYNLVGFSLDPQAPPTFTQFFSPSPAHQQLRIYRLVQDTWQRVANPAGTAMRSGEAFWIYCDSASTYQGPLLVEPSSRHGLVLGAGQEQLILRNVSDHPITPTLQHVTSTAPPVPLSFVLLVTGTPTDLVGAAAVAKPAGAWTQAIPPLEAGQALRLPLEARIQDMQSPLQESLLKVTTDMGTEVWIPVVGLRPDLKEN